MKMAIKQWKGVQHIKRASKMTYALKRSLIQIQRIKKAKHFCLAYQTVMWFLSVITLPQGGNTLVEWWVTHKQTAQGVFKLATNPESHHF